MPQTIARRLSHCAAWWLLLGAWGSGADAASLTPIARERLNAATFEVVLRRPEIDPLTYEKPLPLDLLPFTERTDKYRSIGTAFLIGPNQFVSAAHVISAGAGSQYGPAALRDASGKTYPIKDILKYSSSQDFVVFTVTNPPAAIPLETRDRPTINDAVFAVGNAFGEGVVARDGLYTSDTPEELDGKWKWLRFSAAASPGNSGGPLVDRNGKVIGVVLRKSPSENLNFAVAISQVLEGSTEKASIVSRNVYRLMVANASDAVRIDESFPLPLPIDGFYNQLLKTMQKSIAGNHAAFVKAHGASIFPHGDHSVQLLNSLFAAGQPRVIHETDNGQWTATQPTANRDTLDKNGYIEIGAVRNVALGRFHLPDNLTVKSAFEDSKTFMDLVLKTTQISRPVGADRVRVTSLGKAVEEIWHTDSYGRRWFYRRWNIPYDDTAMVVDALPTPEGCDILAAIAPTGTQEVLREQLALLTDFVYLSYAGSLARWNEFLANPTFLPDAFKNLELKIDYAHGVAITTSRFKFVVPNTLQKSTPESQLSLKFTFLPLFDGASWELGGVFLADTKQEDRYVDVLRRQHPPASMPEEMQHRWRQILAGEAPFNAKRTSATGGWRIEGGVNVKDVAAGKANALYTLAVHTDVGESERSVTRTFEGLERGLTILEH
jgi:hypothetical protein